MSYLIYLRCFLQCSVCTGGTSWLDANDAVLNGAGGKVAQLRRCETKLGVVNGSMPIVSLDAPAWWLKSSPWAFHGCHWSPRLHCLFCVAADYLHRGCTALLNLTKKQWKANGKPCSHDLRGLSLFRRSPQTLKRSACLCFSIASCEVGDPTFR